MTGHELHAIRNSLGMTRHEFADALGYEGSGDTNYKAIKKLETGQRNVSADIERRVMELLAANPVADQEA